jgi:hypothetical protein
MNCLGSSGPYSFKKFVHATVSVMFICLICTRMLFATASITVRLLDAKSGKPLARSTVTLTVTENGKVIFQSHLNTTSNGIAILSLPEPIPERIGLTYATPDLGSCSDLAFPTGEILTAGLVSKNRCYAGELPHPVTARPGEIVLFGSPLTLWERIRREFP